MDLLASEHVAFTIDGAEHEVLTLTGTEAVSELFRFELRCASTETACRPAQLIGRPARLTLRDGRGVERPVAGIVTEAELRVFDDSRALLTVVVQPEAARLTASRDHRIFHDMTVVDIVKDVLGRGGIRARWSTTGSYAERAYTVQHGESDWAFVSRLLEAEGIYYWFDHEAGGSQLVLSDQSAASPPLAEGELIQHVPVSGLAAGRELIFELGPDSRLRPDKFTVRSFDPDHPALLIEGQAGGGSREVYLAPGGGVTSPAAAAAQAEVLRGGAACHGDTVRGASTSVRLTPGRFMSVTGHEHPPLDASYFITAAQVEVKQRQKGTAAADSAPPEVSFQAVRRELSFRSEVTTPVPRQPGLSAGVVVGPPGSEVHPDDKGRVRVQLHWDREGARDERSGHWLRVSQRGTAGSMLLPRIGWNVFTMSEEGSVDLPIALHRFFDAEHPPPYSLPANKTRTVFRTATTPSKGLTQKPGVGLGGGSGSADGVGLGRLSFPAADPTGGFGANEIRFEDKAGWEEMFWNTSKDHRIRIRHDKREQIKADHKRQVVSDHSLDVKADSDETIGGDQTVHIMGNQSESVGGALLKTVNGDEQNDVGSSRKISTGASHTTKVTGTRTLMVGAAQLDVSLGDISATAPRVHTLVGGAAVKATVGNMTETVGKEIAYGGFSGPKSGGVLQTIGGAKLELSKGKRGTKVGKGYTENIGGLAAQLAGGEIEDVATSAQSITTSGSLLAYGGKQVLLGGKTQVLLQCGDSSILLTSQGVTISGTKVRISGGSLIELGAAKVEHN